MYKIEDAKLPILIWADEADLAGFDSAIAQARNLANHPLAQKHVALMPDFHVGYGMPIGGVFATRGGVVPNAVGVDIGCFRGDTEVALLDGTAQTLRDLAGRSKPFWIYALDRSTGRIVPAQATCDRTRRAAKLVEVSISGGARIACTPDHKFLMRDGSWKQAQDLQFNDSLMPLYRSYETRDGYEHVLQPDGRSEPTHKLVYRHAHGAIASGHTVHHMDFNHFNNEPDNLQAMTAGAHSALHRRIVSRNAHWQSSEFEARRVAGIQAMAQTREGHAALAQRGTKNITAYMQNHPEEFAAAVADNGLRGAPFLAAYNRSEKGRAKSSEIGKRQYTCEFCGEEVRGGFGLHNHRRSVHQCNHKVVVVRPLPELEDVYCLHVPGYENFALQAGVFVHNCGMVAGRTDLEAESLDRKTLERLRQAIHRRVPVGFKHHEAVQPLWESASDFDPVRQPVIARSLDPAAHQIGTLGGGNHFVEIQTDESGAVWFMVHSGSRNIGQQVCKYYDGIARGYMKRFHSALPDPDLAFLAEGVPEHDEYLDAMNWCCRFAEESRERMVQAVFAACEEVIGRSFGCEPLIQTHHNYAAMERHMGQDLLVHRKGAVRAEGLVIIPGSMGTASYIAEGKSHPAAFATCSHGAGRVMGRKEANRTITHEQAVKSMQYVVFGVRQGDYEEMPQAYKDIDRVMENQGDLVAPVHRLKPLAVVKG